MCFLIKNKKIYSGSFGSYSLYSFNIMKSISALYGGGITTNDVHFKNFAIKEISKYSNFPNLLLIKQSITYLILYFIRYEIQYKIQICYEISRQRGVLAVSRHTTPAVAGFVMLSR